MFSTQSQIIWNRVNYHIKMYEYLKSRGIVPGKKSKIIRVQPTDKSILRLKANIMG